MPRMILILVLLVGTTAFARAQTAPLPDEIAAYDGLLRAAHEGDVKEVQRLVAAGADVNRRDKRGRTPAHIAAFASRDDVLRELAAAGADMNALDNQSYDVVTIAAVADEPELMSLAISLGNDPGLTTSQWQGTALIAAADLGHVEVVRRLVAAGAPLDHVNNLGWTALMEAVVLGDGGPHHQEVVRLLVKAGASRKIGDRDGVTPIEHARARGYKEMVATLDNGR